MLSQLEVVLADGIDRPGAEAPREILHRDRRTVTREHTKGRAEAEAARGPRFLGACRRIEKSGQGSRREEMAGPPGRTRSRLHHEEDPVLAQVLEDPHEARARHQLDRDRPCEVRGQSSRERDECPLPPGAFGDLGGHVERLLGGELGFEVGKERLPSGGFTSRRQGHALRLIGGFLLRMPIPPYTVTAMQTGSNRYQVPQSTLSRSAVTLRLASLLTLSAGGLGALVRFLTVPALAVLRDPSPTSAPEILTALALAGASVVAAWLWILVAVEALSVLARSRRLAPGDGSSATPPPSDAGSRAPGHRLARRIVALALGAGALGLVGTSAANAVTPAGAGVGHAVVVAERQGPDLGLPAQPRDTSAIHDLQPGWRPSQPDVRPLPDPGFRPTTAQPGAGHPSPVSDSSATSARTVVVLRGDTLWSLAAAQLGPGATDAEIDAAWPQWYDANRPTIGPDPHRLLPGQVLTVPFLVGGQG